tara:strand:- start:283 stop:777 length:495 start_codon:yes stop_codon:yes gene_type:complete
MKTAAAASSRFSQALYRALMLYMLALPLTAVGQAQTDAERFVGNFTLISYVTFPEAGPAVDMEYVGRLSYDTAGNMSGLGMPSGLPEREREAGSRLTGGFAYWGKVTIDDEKKIVIHHVEGSPLMPGWVGGDNVRFYDFEGDLLRLSLKNAEGRTTATLTWRRL